MSRATEEKIRKIIRVSSSSFLDLEPFITNASIVFETVCQAGATASLAGTNPYSYTETHATAIENMLAAHFYAISNPGVTPTVEQVNKIRAQYEMKKPGSGLRTTRFGESAISLDTYNNLAKYSNDQTKIEGSVTAKVPLTVTFVGTSDVYPPPSI